MSSFFCDYFYLISKLDVFRAPGVADLLDFTQRFLKFAFGHYGPATVLDNGPTVVPWPLVADTTHPI